MDPIKFRNQLKLVREFDASQTPIHFTDLLDNIIEYYDILDNSQRKTIAIRLNALIKQNIEYGPTRRLAYIRRIIENRQVEYEEMIKVSDLIEEIRNFNVLCPSKNTANILGGACSVIFSWLENQKTNVVQIMLELLEERNICSDLRQNFSKYT